MNISNRRNPKYICDRCKIEIIDRYKSNKHYKMDKYNCTIKQFDLCENCEKELQKWLKREGNVI